jgi:glycosyltransferase involved in cell wall biosynthesis
VQHQRCARPVRGNPRAAIVLEDPGILRNAFVSTYPPLRCGIATFTHDLGAASGRAEIVAIHPPEPLAPYPREVHHRIRRDEPDDYTRVARALGDCADVVSIQHDFETWGGPNGSHVLDFVGALEVPAVATLHEVLRNPTPDQRAILAALATSVAANVVMSGSAATLLTEVYGVDPARVQLIPHGVPDLPLVDPGTIKPGLGVDAHQVILTFGLLGPAKGVDLMLEALPAVVEAHPSALYVILGPTEPDLIRADGESYRQGLVAKVKALGMGKHVQFIDRFVGRVELTRWLEAADIFVTPYPDLDQTVSGTLSYAMSAGRAIVSSPTAYATELLADGRGSLVAPASATALADAVNALLADDERRAAMGRRAYDHSRPMVWTEVAAAYGRVFERVVGAARPAVEPARYGYR